MPQAPKQQRRTLVVDASNVVGATAAHGERWWRDRSGAMRRLLDRLVAHAEATGERIVLVLDVADPALPAGVHRGVEVVEARRYGRNAADDRIRELLTELAATAESGDLTDAVEVVTSDRLLAADARAAGATVTGAGTFLARLDAPR